MRNKTKPSGIAKDLTGNRYGLLIALKPITQEGQKRKWLCQCDCGNNHLVVTNNLLRGRVKSCGCNQSKFVTDKGYDSGISSRNVLIKNYKNRAASKGHEFTLTLQELEKLFQSDCFYCDRPPSNELKGGKSCRGTYVYNGIDRIDSTKGYTTDNVVSCCRKCNQSKSDLTLEEFVEHIKLLYEKLKGKKLI